MIRAFLWRLYDVIVIRHVITFVANFGLNISETKPDSEMVPMDSYSL